MWTYETQTSATPQTLNTTQTVPNNKIENKTVGTQTELPSDSKENKNTQTTIAKHEIIQLGKTQIPFKIENTSSLNRAGKK